MRARFDHENRPLFFNWIVCVKCVAHWNCFCLCFRRLHSMVLEHIVNPFYLAISHKSAAPAAHLYFLFDDFREGPF